MELNLQQCSAAEINGYEHSHQSKRNLQNCICERDKHRLRLLLPSMWFTDTGASQRSDQRPKWATVTFTRA